MALKSIEIFAGAGGLAIGAHLAGFRSDLMLDSSRRVCETLRYNQTQGIAAMANAEIVEADVRTFDFHKLKGQADLLLGGPPCQPFSQGGRRRHQADERNMFPHAIRALRQMLPQAFLFENVRGLATGRYQNYCQLLRLQLQFPEYAATIENLPWEQQLTKLEDVVTSDGEANAQYHVLVHSLNAADFGVPQKRERIFFAGFRSDLRIEWHFPPPTHSQAALMLSQRFNGEYWDRHKIPKSQRIITPHPSSEVGASLKPWLTTRDAICDLPDPSTTNDTGAMHVLVNGAREYRGHTGSLLDQPSKTLKAGVNGVPGGENMVRFPDGSIRYFTMRECARLQTFPDNFVVPGPRSEQIRQIGNAVPCMLAETILHSMHIALQQNAQWGVGVKLAKT